MSAASSARRHTWPYSLHFDLNQIRALNIATEFSEPKTFRCTLDELVLLRRAYDRIAGAAPAYDYVCGFACGAVPLVSWIARRECTRLFGTDAPRTEYQSLSLQQRLHIFPGLSWADNSEQPFLEFLQAIPVHARLMIVDCSFTGGAIAAIANLLATHREGPSSSIVAIVDETRVDDAKVSGAYALARDHRLAAVVLQEVPSLLAEDFAELLGYDSLNETTDLLPQWQPGLVIVQEGSPANFHVRASHPLHTTFRDLLEPVRPLSFHLDENTVDQACADVLYALVGHMLARGYDDIVAARHDAYTHIKRVGALCAQWRASIRYIEREFHVVCDPEEPRFCADVARHRAILRGEERLVEIAEDAPAGGVFVSVWTAFTDSGNQPRVDFSFRLSLVEIDVIKRSRSGLRESVPSEMLPEFDEMWNQQGDTAKADLSGQWAARRDEFDGFFEDE